MLNQDVILPRFGSGGSNVTKRGPSFGLMLRNTGRVYAGKDESSLELVMPIPVKSGDPILKMRKNISATLNLEMKDKAPL